MGPSGSIKNCLPKGILNSADYLVPLLKIHIAVGHIAYNKSVRNVGAWGNARREAHQEKRQRAKYGVQNCINGCTM